MAGGRALIPFRAVGVVSGSGRNGALFRDVQDRIDELADVLKAGNGVEASAARVADEKPRVSRLKPKVQSPKANAPASASGLCSPAGAVRDGVFFDVEANFRLRWLRSRLQQGAELREDLP